uniref:DUF4220 domain-containing protein n=1 Tax=Leersia perrieri TaxID=77586 RepID=A0A0D9Y120_9ORYZ
MAANTGVPSDGSDLVSLVRLNREIRISTTYPPKNYTGKHFTIFQPSNEAHNSAHDPTVTTGGRERRLRCKAAQHLNPSTKIEFGPAPFGAACKNDFNTGSLRASLAKNRSDFCGEAQMYFLSSSCFRSCVQSRNHLVPGVQELWNTWEIHSLILLSLFLQVILFLFAGKAQLVTGAKHHPMASLPVSRLGGHLRAGSHRGPCDLLEAGQRAVESPFAELGHPSNAPCSAGWQPAQPALKKNLFSPINSYTKIHSAQPFSAQFSQPNRAMVAGYVVAKVPLPDVRLRAAMVIMFLSGSFKYAERTLSLYRASPASLRSKALHNLSLTLNTIREEQGKPFASAWEMDIGMRWVNSDISNLFEAISVGVGQFDLHDLEFLSVDAPLNRVQSILQVDSVPDILERKFMLNPCRCRAYDYIEKCLESSYRDLYTKQPVRATIYNYSRPSCGSRRDKRLGARCVLCIFTLVMLSYSLLQLFSAPIALVLLKTTKKWGGISTADVTVSYILLVGATILEMAYIMPAWTKKRWSQGLAQYNMIKWQLRAAAVLDEPNMIAFVLWQRIRKRLKSLIHDLILVVPRAIREFILDNLLSHGTRREWNCASSRGQLALRRWTSSYNDPNSTLDSSTGSSGGVDFPTSVLIWHIATDIGGDTAAAANSSSGLDKVKTKKEMSRQLSNYVMYLIFKCGVMLNSKSQLIHIKACEVITANFLSAAAVNEKIAAVRIFEGSGYKDEAILVVDHQQQTGTSTASSGSSTSHDVLKRKLMPSFEGAIYYPVMPRARDVARVLLSINNEADRWGLIADVWAEMMYYTAPRCGSAFHYEHLSTGGEFITHLLCLMRLLGPFLPIPDAASPT